MAQSSWLEFFARIEKKEFRVVEMFFAVDRDGSGSLDIGEFEEVTPNMGINLTARDMHLALEELDADGGGDVEQTCKRPTSGAGPGRGPGGLYMGVWPGSVVLLRLNASP